MSVKEEAVQQYQEDEIKKAKDAFAQEVNNLLGEINLISRRLAEAKKRLREMDYTEPTFCSLD